MRCFVGIPLPEDVRRLCCTAMARLRRGLADVRIRWVKDENLHLTLLFLGELPAPSVSAVEEALSRGCSGVRAPRLVLERTGCFTARGSSDVRVLWLGVREEGSGLSELRRTVVRSVAEVLPGMGREEERAFEPHLTLGRVKGRLSMERWRSLEETSGLEGGHPFVASEVVLYSSLLTKDGPIYNPRVRVPLGGEGR